MINDETLKKWHERTSNTPVAWEMAAENLQLASRVLRERRPRDERLLGPELMLRGLAVECFIKSAWLKGGRKLVEDGSFVGIRGAGQHDLVQLAEAAGLTFSAAQRDVLGRLSLYISFAGRYPVPKLVGDWKPRKLFKGGVGPPAHWARPSDDLTYDEIVQLLEEKLRS